MNPVTTPERSILPPQTISNEAQDYLSQAAANPPFDWPPASDVAAWRQRIEERNAAFEPMARAMVEASRVPIVDERVAGVPCYAARPDGWDMDRGTVYLYLHGGAFVFGGGLFAKGHAGRNADKLGVAVVSVDYRMPPDHPFPAAPNDCLAVYEALLTRYPASRIVIGGSSAGGNLAAATTLMIRDKGLPLPAGVVLLTPEVDLTEAGDSFRTNALLDVVLKGGLPACNALYARDAVTLYHPYLSPLHADLKSFPPCFIQTGTRDLFLSNSVLFHRKLRALGIRADLHVWEAMPHGGFGGATREDAELFAEIGAFIRSVT